MTTQPLLTASAALLPLAIACSSNSSPTENASPYAGAPPELSNAAGAGASPASIASAGAAGEPTAPIDTDLPEAPDEALPTCTPASLPLAGSVVVEPQQILNDVSDKPFGINLNYAWDDDNNRPAGARPLAEALKEMGTPHLRYPGGEKADAYFWSVPPYDKAKPTLVRLNANPATIEGAVDLETGEYLLDPMDFDEFRLLVDETGAEPVIVVCHDNLDKFYGTPITKEDMLRTAVEWVRYANVKHSMGIRYWEIGNEYWVAGGPDVTDYAHDVVTFSRAMKAVDPTIQIGATGVTWLKSWETILPIAGYDVDLLIQPSYTGYDWKSYDYYVENDFLNHASNIDLAAEMLWWAPESERERIHIGIPETNSNDFSEKGWKKDNNLGHALVTLDTFLTLMAREKVEYINLWNTRWWPEKDEAGNQLPTALWTALDEQNQILPSGRVLQILSTLLQDNLVQTSGEVAGVVPHASYSPDSGTLTVFLINKGYEPKGINVSWAGSGLSSARHWTFSGDGPDDMAPTWQASCESALGEAQLQVDLAPVSLTVLELLKN